MGDIAEVYEQGKLRLYDRVCGSAGAPEWARRSWRPPRMSGLQLCSHKVSTEYSSIYPVLRLKHKY